MTLKEKRRIAEMPKTSKMYQEGASKGVNYTGWHASYPHNFIEEITSNF